MFFESDSAREISNVSWHYGISAHLAKKIGEGKVNVPNVPPFLSQSRTLLDLQVMKAPSPPVASVEKNALSIASCHPGTDWPLIFRAWMQTRICWRCTLKKVATLLR